MVTFNSNKSESLSDDHRLKPQEKSDPRRCCGISALHHHSQSIPACRLYQEHAGTGISGSSHVKWWCMVPKHFTQERINVIICCEWYAITTWLHALLLSGRRCAGIAWCSSELDSVSSAVLQINKWTLLRVLLDLSFTTCWDCKPPSSGGTAILSHGQSSSCQVRWMREFYNIRIPISLPKMGFRCFTGQSKCCHQTGSILEHKSLVLSSSRIQRSNVHYEVLSNPMTAAFVWVLSFCWHILKLLEQMQLSVPQEGCFWVSG